MNYLTKSDADTAQFGAAIARHLRPGDALLLNGDLGAGKSVLARGIAGALGVTEAMPSPTFTLVQPYQGAQGPVYHFDLYRLSGLDEFEAAGLDEMFDAGGVCLVEWPPPELLPLSRIEIQIGRGTCDDERAIGVDAAHFVRADALLEALKPWRMSE